MRTDGFKDGERVIPGPRFITKEFWADKAFYVVEHGHVVSDDGRSYNAMTEADEWFAPYID